MEKVAARPKGSDTREVYFTYISEPNFIPFELGKMEYDKDGCVLSWNGVFEHERVGNILLSSYAGEQSSSIVRISHRGRSYVYSEIAYRTIDELSLIAQEFALDLFTNVYHGEEYNIENQDLS